MLTVDVAADIVASGIKVVILLVSVLVVLGMCGKWMIIQLHDLCIHLFTQAALLVH
ncbi:hypothetical protein [Escherichia coli]|uniref:hypothetical protein n=1 Tax=Escherichia coli TaxID=562 RepID=UPI00156276F5|nr:hypothetical protein [Escherichia coli]